MDFRTERADDNTVSLIYRARDRMGNNLELRSPIILGSIFFIMPNVPSGMQDLISVRDGEEVSKVLPRSPGHPCLEIPISSLLIYCVCDCFDEIRSSAHSQ